VTHSGVELGALVEELQTAQSELNEMSTQGLMDGQRPLLRVLKVELLGEIKQVAEHVGQIRWLLQEIREKDSECDPRDGTQVLGERNPPSLMDQVEELVRAKLRDGKS
jgi:hypothetical protein